MKKANGSANGSGNGSKNGTGTSSGNGTGKYRKLLLAKKTELLSPLRTKLDKFAGPGGGAAEDLAPVFHDQFVALQLSRVGFHDLKLVEAALERIEKRQYGACLSCGDPISPKRLEAIPWAVCCIDCQERFSPLLGPAQRAEAVA